jgi:hypothetical protein
LHQHVRNLTRRDNLKGRMKCARAPHGARDAMHALTRDPGRNCESSPSAEGVPPAAAGCTEAHACAHLCRCIMHEQRVHAPNRDAGVSRRLCGPRGFLAMAAARGSDESPTCHVSDRQKQLAAAMVRLDDEPEHSRGRGPEATKTYEWVPPLQRHSTTLPLAAPILTQRTSALLRPTLPARRVASTCC